MILAGSHSLQQIIDREVICSGKVHHFSRDIATALEYIHNLKIVHLDLKPSNILVTSYNVAKLGMCDGHITYSDSNIHTLVLPAVIGVTLYRHQFNYNN